MSGAQVSVSAVGFSHPPTIKPIQHNGRVEWHKADCPAPDGKCLAAPLKLGCASPPRPDEQ